MNRYAFNELRTQFENNKVHGGLDYGDLQDLTEKLFAHWDEMRGLIKDRATPTHPCLWMGDKLMTCSGLAKAVKLGVIDWHTMPGELFGGNLIWILRDGEALIRFCPFCGVRIAVP